MTKAKTNKQLINFGLGQEEILELVERGFESLEYDCGIHDVRWDGDEDTTSLYFKDHHGRSWEVYYYNGVNTDTLYANTVKENEEGMLEDKNAKSFKSITATLNHIKRVAA